MRTMLVDDKQSVAGREQDITVGILVGNAGRYVVLVERQLCIFCRRGCRRSIRIEGGPVARRSRLVAVEGVVGGVHLYVGHAGSRTRRGGIAEHGR